MRKTVLDSCSSATDAEALAERLRQYWQVRGYTVRAWSENRPARADRGTMLYCLRSDMINGLPVNYVSNGLPANYVESPNEAK